MSAPATAERLRAENEHLRRRRDHLERRVFRHNAEMADLAFVAAGILEAREVKEIELVTRARRAWHALALVEVRTMEAGSRFRRNPTPENRGRRDALRDVLRELRGLEPKRTSIFDEEAATR